MSSTWVRAGVGRLGVELQADGLGDRHRAHVAVPERGECAFHRRALGIEHTGHVRDVDADAEPHSSSPYQVSKLRPLTCS